MEIKQTVRFGETRVQSLGWEDPLEKGMLSVFNHITQNQKKSAFTS